MSFAKIAWEDFTSVFYYLTVFKVNKKFSGICSQMILLTKDCINIAYL